MRFVLPLILLWGAGCASGAGAENLLGNSSFETPVIAGRAPKGKGGDPTHEAKKSWAGLELQEKGRSSGAIEAGLTDEISHSGRQSFYVLFSQVAAPYQSVILTSNFIPITPGAQYEVSIWGIMDPKNPVEVDGRAIYLKLEVDYFEKDASQSVDEPNYAVQPIPGGKDHEPEFRTDRWYQFRTKITAPAAARFAQVTWRWETGGAGSAGEGSPSSNRKITDGVMYFDDASFSHPLAPDPNLTPAPAVSGTAAR